MAPYINPVACPVASCDVENELPVHEQNDASATLHDLSSYILFDETTTAACFPTKMIDTRRNKADFLARNGQNLSKIPHVLHRLIKLRSKSADIGSLLGPLRVCRM